MAGFAAFATSACGPDLLGPPRCYYEGMEYFEGEQFGPSSECARWVCEQGAHVALFDDRVTIEGDLDLPSQEDVDAQHCLDEVTGTVTLSGTAADLTPLSTLTFVGALEIVASDARSLTGLEGITEVAGGITIADNEQLAALAFRPSLSVFGDVTIQNNDALASLAGAEFLGQCTDCQPRSAHWEGNGDPDAPSFRGYPGGAAEDVDIGPQGGTFYGSIVIADNDALVDLSAMSNLLSAWADVRLRDNDALQTLSALSMLRTVMGDLEVSGNDGLASQDADDFARGVEVSGQTMICENAGGPACG